MSRREGIVKNALNASPIFRNRRFKADFGHSVLICTVSLPRLNGFRRTCSSLGLWPSPFLKKPGEHGAGACGKKPLDPVNAVSVRADEHAVLVSQNSLDDHARSFFRRDHRYFLEILFGFLAGRGVTPLPARALFAIGVAMPAGCTEVTLIELVARSSSRSD